MEKISDRFMLGKARIKRAYDGWVSDGEGYVPGHRDECLRAILAEYEYAVSVIFELTDSMNAMGKLHEATGYDLDLKQYLENLQNERACDGYEFEPDEIPFG